MDKQSNRGKTIKKEVYKAVFICMFILLFATSLMGFRFYYYTGLKKHKDSLNDLASFALSELGSEYMEELYGHTKDAYYSIPEEIRKDPFSEEFRSYIVPNLGERYFRARSILVSCRENTEISNIYFCFYDEEYKRLVIVLDGDTEENFYIPGQYIDSENGSIESWKEIERIMNSSWYLSFAHTDLVGLTTTDYIPFYGKDGTRIGVIAIDINVREFYNELITYIGLFVPALLISFIFLSVLISRLIDKRVVTPVRDLVGAARSYIASDKVNDTENTSYFDSVESCTAYELAQLRDTMSFMEGNIHDSMHEIRRISSERERIAAELNIAAEIQRSALPKSFPEDRRFDFYAAMIPAKEVAGDFYDFFMVDDDHLMMVIADVSGKGVPAALFMMKGKEIIKSRAMRGGKPSEILAFANDQLAVDNENMMFITIWLGMLEISTGVLIAANAGHEFPFVAGEDGVFKVYEEPHGVVCGAMAGMEYEDYTITIPKGGGIFLYTDGVAEANNADGELFGLERIERSLNSQAGLSSAELIDRIKKDIDNYSLGVEQFDDITMLCVMFNK